MRDARPPSALISSLDGVTVLVAAPRALSCPLWLARSAFEAGCLGALHERRHVEQLALIEALDVLREETARRWRS